MPNLEMIRKLCPISEMDRDEICVKPICIRERIQEILRSREPIHIIEERDR